MQFIEVDYYDPNQLTLFDMAVEIWPDTKTAPPTTEDAA